MPIRAHLVGLGLAWLLGADAAMASLPNPPPPQVRCSASGAKLFAPSMTPAAICSRFLGAVGKAGDGLTVELRFLPQGVAMADVTRVRAGKPEPRQRFELAVSDRGFRPADIDRLAADVVTGMRR